MSQYNQFNLGVGDGGEINLLDYWRVILHYKWMIASIVVVASTVAVISSLFMANVYRAESLIIPMIAKGGDGGMSSLASQFGSLASLAGIRLPDGAGDTERFMAILRSRTLSEDVIKRENLIPILLAESWDVKRGMWKSDDPTKQPTMEDAVGVLKGIVGVVDDKKNRTIKITGDFKDPRIAAWLVNVYVDELQRFLNTNTLTMAKRNRLFIEEQLEENKQELLEAGKEINDFYRTKQISSAEAKVDVPITKKERSPENKDQGITTNERAGGPPLLVQNESETTAVDGVVRADVSQPAVMDEGDLPKAMTQKEELEKKIADAKVVKNVPQQVYLTYLMLRRELLAKVNAMLTSQYEMAKIEESREDLAFQVIDKAVPPEKKFKPKRSRICITAFIASLLGAIILAFCLDYLARMKAQAAARSS